MVFNDANRDMADLEIHMCRSKHSYPPVLPMWLTRAVNKDFGGVGGHKVLVALGGEVVLVVVSVVEVVVVVLAEVVVVVVVFGGCGWGFLGAGGAGRRGRTGRGGGGGRSGGEE